MGEGSPSQRGHLCGFPASPQPHLPFSLFKRKAAKGIHYKN